MCRYLHEQVAEIGNKIIIVAVGTEGEVVSTIICNRKYVVIDL